MADSARPLPRIDGNSARYWQAAGQGRLCLPQCAQCRRWSFPPLPRCKHCLSDRLDWNDLSGRGAVHAFCIVHVDVVGGFEPPYAVIEVELDEQPGLLMFSNMLDCEIDQIRIGQRVEVCFERRNDDISLPQYRPAAETTSPNSQP